MYTYNPFSQFLPAPDGNIVVEDSENLRMDFAVGLRVLQEWSPVIEEGLIFPFPHADHYCHYCLAQAAFGDDAGQRLAVALAAYKRRFAREARVAVEQDEYGYLLHVQGPESLVPYGELTQDLDRLPPSLRTLGALRRLRLAGRVAVPPRTAQGMDISGSYANDILQTLRYGLAANQALGAGYVTDAEAEAQMLTAMSGGRGIVELNRIAAKQGKNILDSSTQKSQDIGGVATIAISLGELSPLMFPRYLRRENYRCGRRIR